VGVKIKRTKKGARISLTASDVDSAVMQFICACHPEFARGYSISTLDAQAATAEAILVRPVHRAGKNDIGVPGTQGFGVGVCPETLPPGMTALPGCEDPAGDSYGNYTFSDGSVMVWIPAFYYRITDGVHVDIQPFSRFSGTADAYEAGYALHRAFHDGGMIHPGVFVDKFKCSNNGGIASSVKNGSPLSTSSSHNPINKLNGSPVNAYYGTIAAAKTRGADFFVNSRFIHSALALLSLAHAAASSDTTWCGWYDPRHNFPKGCNNGNLGDYYDKELQFEAAGYGSCGKTGSANHLDRTTHNGQNCGVADLSGLMYEVTPGLTSDGKILHALKPTVAMKDLTAGDTLKSDLWGTKGRKHNYDPLPASGGFPIAEGYNNFGDELNTLSGDMDGIGWQLAGAGIALPGKPKNPLLNGGFWNYPNRDMVPLSCMFWYSATGAGVWSVYLSHTRSPSRSGVGFRCACYLV
jgi:hypothetical protein